MIKHIRPAAMAALGIVAMLSIHPAHAVDRQTFTYSFEGSESAYVEQHSIDATDVPGHTVRVFDIRITFAKDPPVFKGVKATGFRYQGFSDYTNGTGAAAIYGTYMLEDGSKVYARISGLSQAISGEDGSRRLEFFQTGTLTGGTGPFAKVRGTLRQNGSFDPKAGYIQGRATGEYWFE